MKLSKSAIVGVILLLVLAVGAYSLFTGSGQSEFRSESGFRGLKWGAPMSEHEYATRSDFQSLGGSEDFIKYKAKREKEYLGDVPLYQISYTFLIDNGVEKFESVELALPYSWIYAGMSKEKPWEKQVLDILAKEYGKYTEEGDSAKNKKYVFENDHVTAYYEPEQGITGEGQIIISSKEMRSRYLKIYEKAEEEAKKKEEEAKKEAEKEAKRKAADF